MTSSWKAYAKEIDGFKTTTSGLESTEDNPVVKPKWADFDTEFKKYLDMVQQSYDLKKDGKTQEAIDASNGDVRNIRRKIVGIFNDILASYKADMDQSRVDMMTAGADARLHQKLITIIGLLLAYSIIGFIVVKQISQPIARVTTALDRLAAGEINIPVPEVDRSDEVGKLTNALGVCSKPMRWKTSVWNKNRNVWKKNWRKPVAVTC